MSADSQYQPLQELANYRVRGKQQRCKVTAIGWYGPHGRPVTLGEMFEMDAAEARTQKSFERVEFV
jgi:elongation factor P hydroxylase